MKKVIALATTTFALTANAAFAVGGNCINGVNITNGQPCGSAVPEISALEGTAALAALAAIVFIAWERRRRAS